MNGEANPEAGKILVTFDAGGMGSSVNANPQVFVILDEDSFFAEWHLHREMHLGPGFTVELGNVVPCHDRDIKRVLTGYTFESTPILQKGRATAWRWTFTREPGDAKCGEVAAPPPQNLIGEIEYEIFFSYGPALQNLERSSRRTISLRKSHSIDPSLILPPVKSGSGGGNPLPQTEEG